MKREFCKRKNNRMNSERNRIIDRVVPALFAMLLLLAGLIDAGTGIKIHADAPGAEREGVSESTDQTGVPYTEARKQVDSAEDAKEKTQGYCLNEQCTFEIKKKSDLSDILDDREPTVLKISASTPIKITSTEPIGGLYIKFDRIPEKYTVSAGDAVYRCGENGFLHEYTEISRDNVKTLTVTFSNTVHVCDIYVLSKGETPDWVQKWRSAEGYADVMLMISHSDDDQLFFAGSIPDAVARGAEMQVCYFTRHWSATGGSYTRYHELLNGLWTCGLTRYPITGVIPDYWSNSEEMALIRYETDGITYDDMVRLKVTLIRRYHPQVVLGHDVNGEYGHGTHILDSRTTRDAVVAAADKEKYPASEKVYGVWDTPKTYIHLYGENKIDFEIDQPLPYFNGKTAYEVSQEAFLCHLSQRSTRYTEWLLGTEENPVTLASQFPMYGPRNYGLWRTTVGADTNASDFYQNIEFYSVQDQNNPPADRVEKTESQLKAEALFMVNERAEQQDHLYFVEVIKCVVAISLVLFFAVVLFRRKKIREVQELKSFRVRLNP